MPSEARRKDKAGQIEKFTIEDREYGGQPAPSAGARHLLMRAMLANIIVSTLRVQHG